MNAKKVDVAEVPKKEKPRKLPSASRWVGVGLLLAVLMSALWAVAWRKVQPHVYASDEYQVHPSSIRLNPAPPPWIHSDITAEVLRDANLVAPLSVLQPDLTARIAQAYALHPWVAKVNRVTKRHPAQVDVALVYRRPAAMVRSTQGSFPVDAEGVVLPSGDFAPTDVERYPLLAEIKSEPLGTVGTRWGDARVQGGAAIASALSDHWQRLELVRIVPAGQPITEGDRETYSFEIFTSAGTRILWGRPPGAERTGELTAEQKLGRLVDYAAQHGSLDKVEGQIIDMRTAITPLPERPAKRPSRPRR